MLHNTYGITRNTNSEQERMALSLIPWRPAQAAEIPRQADNDEQVIAMWLRKKSEQTQVNYRRDVARLFRVIGGKRIADVTLRDLHTFDEHLEREGLMVSSRVRTVSTIRSLLTFSAKIGYTRFNVGLAFEAEKVDRNLAEKLISVEQVMAILALEPVRRNKVLLRLLYATGIRVSEAAGLKWKHATAREDRGQITVFGKGGKFRSIPVPKTTWEMLLSLRGDAGDDDLVFRIGRNQIWAVVKQAGIRADVPQAHPHILRHAHASHAMDRGCVVTLVQATLGHSSVSTTSMYVHARPGDG